MTSNSSAPSPIVAVDPFGRFMKLPDVEVSTGLKRTKLYELMKSADSRFPRPIKIDNASVWIEAEVVAWKSAQIAEARRLDDPISVFRSRLGAIGSIG